MIIYLYFSFFSYPFSFSFYFFWYSDVTFINQDNYEKTVKAKIGDSILKVAHDNHINIEGK